MCVNGCIRVLGSPRHLNCSSILHLSSKETIQMHMEPLESGKGRMDAEKEKTRFFLAKIRQHETQHTHELS